MTSTQILHLAHALLPDGFAENVTLTVEGGLVNASLGGSIEG